LDPDELERLAVAVEELSEDQIAAELSRLPANWIVTDDELEAVVRFAVYRGPRTALRTRMLI